MKVFSMFSGIGGFEKGISYISPEAEFIGHSEIDKYADMVHKYHYLNCHNYGDATKINEKELPDFDVLVGGFPCQSFSIAGKRGGINADTRGTLFQEIIRIAKEKRPRVVLLENVRGLLSSSKGWDFATILYNLVQLGYSIEYEVLNSKNFGVPQNRERVFIVGYFGEGSGSKIFPLGKNESVSKKRKVKSKIASCLNSRVHKMGDCDNYIIHNLQPRSGDPKKGGTGHLSKQDGNTYTIDTNCSNAVESQNKIRRLTPKECERLQGFPDDWTKYGINESGETVEISDTQRYKTLGNSVTVNVISAIWDKIVKYNLFDKE